MIRRSNRLPAEPTEMKVSVIPVTQKRSNGRLFSLARTHSVQIFGEIPFIKPQNDT